MGKQQLIQHQITAVNDLVLINNDLAAGYQKALDETADSALQALWKKYRDLCLQNADELKGVIRRLGGDPAANTTLAGKIYFMWLDLKTKLAGTNTVSVIDASEQSEYIAEKAYQEARQNKELIWQDWQMASLLKRQLRGLTAVHEEIAALRA